MKKILTVVGARPQFIKCSILRKEFFKHNIKETLIHTGQHYDLDMSKIFFQELKIKKPDYSFTPKQRDHSGITGEIMTFVAKIILKEKPDLCLVYGDTNSTLAGALAAAKNEIPVCHVESGLRSFNNSMPEEINRKLTDHISDYHFCPTKESVKNLFRENIKKNVFLVGDIMLDVAKHFSRKKTNLRCFLAYE